MEVWHNFDGAECVIYIGGREWSDGIRTSRDLRAAINCGVPRKRREIFRKFDAFASSVIAAMGFEFKA